MTVSPSVQISLIVLAAFTILVAFLTQKAQQRIEAADMSARRDREALRKQQAITSALKAELEQYHRKAVGQAPRKPEH